MNDTVPAPEVSGLSKHTTKRREWWGWFGSMSWLFFMMYGYEAVIYDAMTISFDSDMNPSLYPFFFMILFALSIAVFSWRFGRDPAGLSRIAQYSMPVAFVITAVFAVLPQPIGSILYMISPVFMAPAITRRVYGVLYTAGPSRRLTRYMSGIVACVAAFTAWLIIELPLGIAFIVPALLSTPAWIGVRRSPSLTEGTVQKDSYKFPKRILILLIAAIITLFVLDFLHSVIHSVIYMISDELTEIILSVMVLILPLVGFMIYAIINDKGHERIGFICGMALFLIGIQLAFLVGEPGSTLAVVLAITDSLGGSYTEFFILTIPIFFMVGAKRPIFVASLGVMINLLSSAFGQQAYLMIPETFLTLDTPLLVTESILSLIFIVLVYVLFVNQREKSLATALFSLLHSRSKDAGAAQAEESLAAEAPIAADAPPDSASPATPGAIIEKRLRKTDLTQDEIKVAMLLIEGNSRSDILRKLHISAADAAKHENSIRKKVLALDPDPAVSAIVAEFKLTKRETDILRYLRQSMTNAAMAEELFLSEETVKLHVRSLMNKLPISNRSEVAEWANTFAAK